LTGLANGLAVLDASNIKIDVGAFLLVVVASAVAGTISAVAASRNLLLPSVVLELVLGIIIGPQVLDIIEPTGLLQFFSDLGLGMLFFFAGYEIDLRRIAGRPLELALAGWALSLVIAYTVGGILAAAGIVLSLVYTGSALATTAIGTLIPILSDSGELETRFGTYLLSAGAVGEFGPIMLLTLILSSQNTLHSALILVLFVLLAVVVAALAVRSSGRTLPVLLERTLEESSQLAVRWIMVLVFTLALLASDLGLDLLLGGFAAGLITREVLRGREVTTFYSKLTAVGFGFFIPFFFVFSGMNLALNALFQSPTGVEKLVIFLGLFLVVRGVPALVLYRKVLDARERLALAFFTSTQLPLVLAITTIALAKDHMRPSTAAALVSAAVLSTLIYPLVGLRIRAGDRRDRERVAEAV
jgi:Kef-type K+ transport system membrane component KefB